MNNVPYGLGAKRPEPVLPCTGACRGDRPAWDGPARFGRMPDGTRTIFCTCCMHVLTPVEALAPAPHLTSRAASTRPERSGGSASPAATTRSCSRN